MKDLNDHCTECKAHVPLVDGRQPYHPFLYCELVKLGHHDPAAYLAEYGFRRIDDAAGERAKRQVQFLEIMADGAALQVNGIPWREAFERLNTVVSDGLPPEEAMDTVVGG